MVAAYSPFSRCRSCIRKNGDSCRFKFFRAFVESGRRLIAGPYFVDGDDPLVAESKARGIAIGKARLRAESNAAAAAAAVAASSASITAPATPSLPCSVPSPTPSGPAVAPMYAMPAPDPAAEDAIRALIACPLLAELEREAALLAATNPCFHRPAVPRLRQMCDVCMTSLFNCHWICCVCGAEMCITCYDEWDDSAAHAAAEAAAAAAANSTCAADEADHAAFGSLPVGGGAALTREHAAKIAICSHRKRHLKRQFALAYRYPNTVFQETLANVRAYVRSSPGLAAGASVVPADSCGTATDSKDIATDSKDTAAAAPEPPDAPTPDADARVEPAVGTLAGADGTPPPFRSVRTFLDGIASREELDAEWALRRPMVVHMSKPLTCDWSPEYFIRTFGTETPGLVDCRQGNVVGGETVASFFSGFLDSEKRRRDKSLRPMVLKMKDWPADVDFKDKMPEHFAEITRVLPMPHLHRRNAPFNLATRVPTEFQTVDLGPKLYIAHGTHDGPGSAGTTPLHLDMTDAVNLMLRSSAPSGGHASVGDDSERAGALWHIFDPASAPLLRAFITKVAAERGLRVDDSIHDQRWYLDRDLLARLASEHGVLPWRVLQRPGDAIFIPAGCPHQVCNLQDCIKIAMDFVSPHNIDQSLRLTDEFRRLSSTHQRKSDLLHPKSIIYYAWRSCMDAAAARSASAASAASASLASPESAPMASPLASTESPMPSSSQTCNAVPGDAIASVKSESVLGGGGVGGEGESHMDLDDPSPASSDAAAVPADHAIDTKTMPASDLDKRGCNSSGEYCDDEMANSCLVDIDVVG